MGVSLCVGGKSYAQWSYSGFNAFRKKLAREIGIDLGQMQGYSSLDKEELLKEGFDVYRQAVINEEARGGKRKWSTVEDDIVPLLHHSDCEGKLSPAVCAKVGPRLAELIKDWPENMEFDTNPYWQERGYPAHMVIDDHDTKNAKGLVEAMRIAAETGRPLEFH